MTVGSVCGPYLRVRAGRPRPPTPGPRTAWTPSTDEHDLQDGQFYDPDAEYEPDPEYAATLAPDAARQRRERVGPTGRPLPYFPIPNPLGNHGPAKIVAMCNQKGGVGKTTSTINLGAALAEYGRRVLLVDFDPQGALSVGLGVNPMELDITVYNLLMERGLAADEVLLKTAVPGMDLLPSNIDLSAAEVQLVSEVARESDAAARPQAADATTTTTSSSTASPRSACSPSTRSPRRTR